MTTIVSIVLPIVVTTLRYHLIIPLMCSVQLDGPNQVQYPAVGRVPGYPPTENTRKYPRYPGTVPPRQKE